MGVWRLVTNQSVNPNAALGDLFENAPHADTELQTEIPRKVQQRAVAPPLKTQPDPRFFSVEQVMERYSVARATIWRWVAKGQGFPKPIKLSSGTSRWSEDQLADFEALSLSHQSLGTTDEVLGPVQGSTKGAVS